MQLLSIIEIEVLSIFQQVAVCRNLSVQLEFDVPLGLVFLHMALLPCLSLCQLQLQIQRDQVEMLYLHGKAGPPSLKLFSRLTFIFLLESKSVSKDGAVHLSSENNSLQFNLSGLHSDHHGALFSVLA